MLKVTSAAERAIWGLVRWAIALGGPARLVGEAVVDELKPPAREVVPVAQLALWVLDAQGLPVRPWRLSGEAVIRCRALGCILTAHECVFRQMVSDLERTQDTWRGQGSEYPSCVSARCPQGKGVREALSQDELAACEREAKAAARNRDRDKSHAEKGRQRAARRSLERVGLLDEVSTADALAVSEESLQEWREVQDVRGASEPSPGDAGRRYAARRAKR